MSIEVLKKCSEYDHQLIVFSISLFIILLSSFPVSAQLQNPEFNGSVSSRYDNADYPGVSWVWRSSYYNGVLWSNAACEGHAMLETRTNCPYADQVTYFYQDVNLTDYVELTFNVEKGSVWGYYVPVSVYIDNDLIGSFCADSSWDVSGYSENVSLNVSGYTGVHTLKFEMVAENQNSEAGYCCYYIDDCYLRKVPSRASVELWQYGDFVSGLNGRLYATIQDAKATDVFYLDIYIRGSNYTKINTSSITALYGDASYPFDFSVPSSESMDKGLYFVIRDDENYTYDSVTYAVLPSSGAYFFVYPSVIGYDEPATLYYKYNLSSPHYGGEKFFITDLYFDSGGFNEAPIKVYKDLNNVDSGSITFDGYNYSRVVYGVNGSSIVYNDVNAKVGIGLIRNYKELLADYSTNHVLATAELRISGNSSSPEIPYYTHLPAPAGATNNTDVPSIPNVPDEYDSPDSPHPSSPSNDDDGDYNPNYENNNPYNDTSGQSEPDTSYNSSSGQWEYNNSTGGGDGYYPINVPGNTSVDDSRIIGYYSAVDSAYEPLNRTVYGVTGFLLSPVTSLNDSINSVNVEFDNTTDGMLNNSILIEVVAPVFTGLPEPLQQLGCFSLLLSIIGLILTRS